MRAHAEARGVARLEGKVVEVERDGQSGNVAALLMEDGSRIEGDLFIDCTGFFGLLIEKTLESGYDDWSEWLPADSAVAAPCESAGPPTPYTTATAHEDGWSWRIPLQHRTGNGHVYSSQFLSDDQAADTLLKGLEGKPLAEPRQLRFVTGKRRKLWNRNVVAIGLSGGFLEPLESTSIFLIQEGITKLLELFPSTQDCDIEIGEYNRWMDLQFERIRDFLVLHYHATERNDSEFWNHMRTMRVPDSLQARLDLFRAHGHVSSYEHGLFLDPSWIAVLVGQRVLPDGYDKRADRLPDGLVRQHLAGLKAHMASAAASMEDHASYLAQYAGMGRAA